MIINYCFHGIGRSVIEREPGEARYWITKEFFLRVLDEVVGRADVRLSFDDGNVSDTAIALPALTERGLTATFFVLAGRLDDPASLGAPELRQLRAAGMDVGSHGWAHVPWRGLNEADSRREIVDAREALVEASDGQIDVAAMPLGRYDRTLLNRLRRADYRTVFTSDRMPARLDSWMQARYSATEADTVASVQATLSTRVRPRDFRNIAASWVKRVR